MTAGFVPLLRSPPFPWVAPEIAAVSVPGPSGRPAHDHDTLFRAIRAARVGGAFWRPAATRVSGPQAILAPIPHAQVAAMIAASAHDPARGVRGLDGKPCDPRSNPVPPERWADPWSLLVGDTVVHADADHEIVALAAITGTPVRLYGKGRFGREGGEVDIAAVVRALVEPRYRDPFTATTATAEAVIATLARWRALIDANHPIAALVGIARWKQRHLGRLFWAPRDRPLSFARGTGDALRAARDGGDCVVAWPSREPPELREHAARHGVSVQTVEDGFIRSAGLGSGLHPPFSVVVDPDGIHYDPARPSRLDHLLETIDPSPELLNRARALRATLVAGNVAKYGAGRGTLVPPRVANRRLVLVPGQVSDDLSVRRGGRGMQGNSDLLANVRAAEPDAEIWYRPHPDVDAGHRRGATPDAAVLRHADRVVRGQAMPDLLDTVDAVHVLTSLTGFEALLRGREVVTHGTPFFAGWGLTVDLAPTPPGRTRRLSLDQLVAGALILYPRYLDPATHLPCEVEHLVHALLMQALPHQTLVTRLREVQGRVARHLTRVS